MATNFSKFLQFFLFKCAITPLIVITTEIEELGVFWKILQQPLYMLHNQRKEQKQSEN